MQSLGPSSQKPHRKWLKSWSGERYHPDSACSLALCACRNKFCSARHPHFSVPCTPCRIYLLEREGTDIHDFHARGCFNGSRVCQCVDGARARFAGILSGAVTSPDIRRASCRRTRTSSAGGARAGSRGWGWARKPGRHPLHGTLCWLPWPRYGRRARSQPVRRRVGTRSGR